MAKIELTPDQRKAVEDRGGSGIENDIARVDIYVEDHKQALRLGRYWAEATFYRIGR